MSGPHPYWPLFDLLIRTPRLEIRLPREDEFTALLAVVDGGIHDPDTMPFAQPWTDLPPRRRSREAAQWWWRQRAEWSVDRWSFTGAIFVDGEIAGVQDIGADHFGTVRSVSTGSWLGRRFQGQGLGKEMRQAMLHLAFAGLGAKEALSGAFEDNEASLRTSYSVGYRDNGEALSTRRDGVGRTIRVRIDRPTWEGMRRDDIELIGLDGCIDMFIGRSTSP